MTARQEFHINRSRWLLCYLYLIHLSMLLAAWLVPVPLWLSATVTATLIASFCYSLHHYRKTLVIVASSESWLLRERSGEQRQVELLPPCYISRWLTVVPIVVSGKRRHLLICRDSLDGDNYRRLSVILRSETS